MTGAAVFHAVVMIFQPVRRWLKHAALGFEQVAYRSQLGKALFVFCESFVRLDVEAVCFCRDDDPFRERELSLVMVLYR